MPSPGSLRTVPTPPPPAAAVYSGTLYTRPDPLPAASSLLPVSFTAPDSGVGELTWGQREIWNAMTRQGWLNLGGTQRIPPGTTLPDIADELRYLMTRYPSFRTRLRFDHNGRPTQEVFGSGQVLIEVYDADDETADATDAADATAAIAATVDAHYRTATRDFAGEWPIRMGVVRRHGELTHLVVQTCHLVTDAAGMQVITRETATRDTTPPSGMSTLELARWQGSEAGQRHHANVERHWRRALDSLPERSSPADADPREPRHWSGQLDSPALQLAVPVIAERTRTDSSAVFLTLYAIALGRTGVLNPAVIRPLSGNRFRPGMPELVSNLVQSGICVLNLSDTTVDEAVRRTKRALLTAYKYAYFDAEKIAALLERTALERGPQLGLTNYFNDRRIEHDLKPAVQPVTAQRLRDAVDGGAFHWFEKKDNPFEPLFLHVQDDPDSIGLQVCADTHLVSPASMEALVRTMEAVAVEAALDPAAVTGVPAPGVVVSGAVDV
jgi:hypothetical protein